MTLSWSVKYCNVSSHLNYELSSKLSIGPPSLLGGGEVTAICTSSYFFINTTAKKNYTSH